MFMVFMFDFLITLFCNLIGCGPGREEDVNFAYYKVTSLLAGNTWEALQFGKYMFSTLGRCKRAVVCNIVSNW